MKCQVSFRPKTWYLHSEKITDVNYIIKIAPYDAALSKILKWNDLVFHLCLYN